MCHRLAPGLPPCWHGEPAAAAARRQRQVEMSELRLEQAAVVPHRHLPYRAAEGGRRCPAQLRPRGLASCGGAAGHAEGHAAQAPGREGYSQKPLDRPGKGKPKDRAGDFPYEASPSARRPPRCQLLRPCHHGLLPPQLLRHQCGRSRGPCVQLVQQGLAPRVPPRGVAGPAAQDGGALVLPGLPAFPPGRRAPLPQKLSLAAQPVLQDPQGADGGKGQRLAARFRGH
mmetsp:Transcript_22795/g.63299  ORF Transcript_22795/g.63299 Transcript_22795/m.63299 type:complete len:228 (-) Transcript_22795:690-1373(-)